MKKKIIVASATSAVLAAMPVVGAFATVLEPGALVDQLVVNLSATCSITRGNMADANGAGFKKHDDGAENNAVDTNDYGTQVSAKAGTWTLDTDTSATTHVQDTLTGTISAGQLYNDFGSSYFTVRCNNSEGWKVTAATSNADGTLRNSDYDTASDKTGKALPLASVVTNSATNGWSYTSSAVTTTGANMDSSNFIEHTAAANEIVAQTDASAANKATGNDGQTFKIQYAVIADYSMEEASYTGAITYTLAEL